MAKKAAKKVAAEPVVVASKVKAFVKSQGLLCSSEIPGALNEVVGCLLAKAVKRAAANGRKTLKPQDL